AAVQARARGAHGMALEVDTFRAAVLADAGSAEEALDLVRAAARAADELGSGLNAVWARAVEGHILLRVDADAALEVVAAALEEARAARYPAGGAANLRTLVIGELLLGRQGPAVQASAELLDEIAVNGPSIELRMVLLTAAAVLHRAGLPSWRAVAAAGRDLPAVSVLSRAGEEVLGLPDPGEAGAAGLPPGEAL